MGKIFILFGALLLTAAPAQAQSGTPTAPPFSPSTIRDLSDAAQVFGPVVVALFLLLLATVVLSVIAAWKLWLPTIQANQQANQQIMSMSAQLSQAQINTLNAQTETANAIGKMGVAVADLETRQEAQRRQEEIQKNSNTNTQAINDHTTSAVRPLNDGIGEIKQTLNGAVDKLTEVATRDDLGKLIEPITEDLQRVIDRFDKLEAAVREMIADRTRVTPPENPP